MGQDMQDEGHRIKVFLKETQNQTIPMSGSGVLYAGTKNSM